MTFVDSSAWVAIFVENDTFNKRAIKIKTNLKNEEIYTSDVVIWETLGWIRNKIGKMKAVSVGKWLYQSEGMSIVRFLSKDEKVAWKLFRRLDGRGVSMIDCISMAMMKRLKIRNIFTFDRDFEKAGFRVLPE